MCLPSLPHDQSLGPLAKFITDFPPKIHHCPSPAHLVFRWVLLFENSLACLLPFHPFHPSGWGSSSLYGYFLLWLWHLHAASHVFLLAHLGQLALFPGKALTHSVSLEWALIMHETLYPALMLLISWTEVPAGRFIATFGPQIVFCLAG